jgi:hypothetical protein
MTQHVLPVPGDFYIFTVVDRFQRGGRAAGSGAARNCLLIVVAPYP